jgi:hypothetical protein
MTLMHNEEQEIRSPETTEVEQEHITEFEQTTEHPQGDDTRVQSQEMAKMPII